MHSWSCGILASIRVDSHVHSSTHAKSGGGNRNEECNDDDHTAEQKLALVRMLLTQHFKMLEQATISGGAFGAAWPHSFLPPIEGGQAVGASAADRAAVATDVTNRARLAEALKKAEK